MSRLDAILKGFGETPQEGAIEAPIKPSPPSFALNPRERALADQVAAHFEIDPTTYIALPVQLMIDQSRPGQIAPMQTPNGVVEMVVIPFVMVLPKANLKMSTVLLPDGNAPDPLLGMLPSMEGRLVVPEGRLQPKVLEALKNSDNGSN